MKQITYGQTRQGPFEAVETHDDHYVVIVSGQPNVLPFSILGGQGVVQDWVGDPPEPPEPKPVVPQAITMRQARLVLMGVGLLDDVDVAIENIPDPIIKKAAKIEWEFSSELLRGNAFVAMLAPSLQLTSEQIDNLFIEGSKL